MASAKSNAHSTGEKSALRMVLFFLCFVVCIGCMYLLFDFQHSLQPKLSGELILGQVETVSYKYQDAPIRSFLFEYFGLLSYLLCLMIVYVGYFIFLRPTDIWHVDFYRTSLRILGFNILFLSFAAILSRYMDLFSTGAGGLLGDMLILFSDSILSQAISFFIFVLLAFCGLTLLFGSTPIGFFEYLGDGVFKVLHNRNDHPKSTVSYGVVTPSDAVKGKKKAEDDLSNAATKDNKTKSEIADENISNFANTANLTNLADVAKAVSDSLNAANNLVDSVSASSRDSENMAENVVASALEGVDAALAAQAAQNQNQVFAQVEQDLAQGNEQDLNPDLNQGLVQENAQNMEQEDNQDLGSSSFSSDFFAQAMAQGMGSQGTISREIPAISPAYVPISNDDSGHLPIQGQMSSQEQMGLSEPMEASEQMQEQAWQAQQALKAFVSQDKSDKSDYGMYSGDNSSANAVDNRDVNTPNTTRDNANFYEDEQSYGEVPYAESDYVNEAEYEEGVGVVNNAAFNGKDSYSEGFNGADQEASASLAPFARGQLYDSQAIVEPMQGNELDTAAEAEVPSMPAMPVMPHFTEPLEELPYDALQERRKFEAEAAAVSSSMQVKPFTKEQEEALGIKSTAKDDNALVNESQEQIQKQIVVEQVAPSQEQVKASAALEEQNAMHPDVQSVGESEKMEPQTDVESAMESQKGAEQEASVKAVDSLEQAASKSSNKDSFTSVSADATTNVIATKIAVESVKGNAAKVEQAEVVSEVRSSATSSINVAVTELKEESKAESSENSEQPKAEIEVEVKAELARADESVQSAEKDEAEYSPYGYGTYAEKVARTRRNQVDEADKEFAKSDKTYAAENSAGDEIAKANQESTDKSSSVAQDQATNIAADVAELNEDADEKAKDKVKLEEEEKKEDDNAVHTIVQRTDPEVFAAQLAAIRKAREEAEAKAKEEAVAKAKAEAEAKAKEEAEAKVKAEEEEARLAAEAEAKAKEEAEAKAKEEERLAAEAEAKAKAEEEARLAAEAEAKAKAEEEAIAKAEAEAKAKAEAEKPIYAGTYASRLMQQQKQAGEAKDKDSSYTISSVQAKNNATESDDVDSNTEKDQAPSTIIQDTRKEFEAAQERARAEAKAKEEEEARLAAEAEAKAKEEEEARLAAEAEAKAKEEEEARLAAEAEAKAKAEEEARLAAEAEARAKEEEEARLAAEAEAKAKEEEEARLAAEAEAKAKAEEEARLAAEAEARAKAEEEVRLAAEEARIVAEARAAEEAHLAEEKAQNAAYAEANGQESRKFKESSILEMLSDLASELKSVTDSSLTKRYAHDSSLDDASSVFTAETIGTTTASSIFAGSSSLERSDSGEVNVNMGSSLDREHSVLAGVQVSSNNANTFTHGTNTSDGLGASESHADEANMAMEKDEDFLKYATARSNAQQAGATFDDPVTVDLFNDDEDQGQAHALSVNNIANAAADEDADVDNQGIDDFVTGATYTSSSSTDGMRTQNFNFAQLAQAKEIAATAASAAQAERALTSTNVQELNAALKDMAAMVDGNGENSKSDNIISFNNFNQSESPSYELDKLTPSFIPEANDNADQEQTHLSRGELNNLYEQDMDESHASYAQASDSITNQPAVADVSTPAADNGDEYDDDYDGEEELANEVYDEGDDAALKAHSAMSSTAADSYIADEDLASDEVDNGDYADDADYDESEEGDEDDESIEDDEVESGLINQGVNSNALQGQQPLAASMQTIPQGQALYSSLPTGQQVQYMRMPNGQYVPVMATNMPSNGMVYPNIPMQAMSNMPMTTMPTASMAQSAMPQYVQMPNGQYVPIMQPASNVVYPPLATSPMTSVNPMSLANQALMASVAAMTQGVQAQNADAENATNMDTPSANIAPDVSAGTVEPVPEGSDYLGDGLPESALAMVRELLDDEDEDEADYTQAGANAANTDTNATRTSTNASVAGGSHSSIDNVNAAFGGGSPAMSHDFKGAHNNSNSNLPNYMAGVSSSVSISFDTSKSLSLCSVPRHSYDEWRPSLDLLARSHEHVETSIEELEKTSERINSVLHSFGVKATVADYLTGPVITRFDLDLAPGVKSSAISSIETELCRNLLVSNVRVVPIIDGSSYVGLEVPNAKRQLITLGDMVTSREFAHTKASLPMCLGASVVGEPVVKDLAETPHLLVAGTTGSGKSAGLNTMLISLLLKRSPAELRLILVDPKQLEFSIYKDLPHLLTPVITDVAEKTPIALNWCVDEMERRFKLMSKLGVRKLAEYNELIKNEQAQGRGVPDPLWTAEMGPVAQNLKPLPWIVVVVEEFADLMAQSGRKKDKDTPESLIARLSAKSRAAGIHLVLVTQTPRSEVVTGMIKANFPSRIAFTVQSRLDSTIVLDDKGAETLLGNGDMLYKFTGANSPTRAHGAFTSNNDVKEVVDAWRQKAGVPEYLEDVIAVVEEEHDNDNEEKIDKLDVKFDQAVELVRSYMQAQNKVPSVSDIQAELGVGWPRAKKIFKQLTSEGVIN